MLKYQFNHAAYWFLTALFAIGLVLPTLAIAVEMTVGEAVYHDTSLPLKSMASGKAVTAGANRTVPLRKRPHNGRFPDLAEPDGGLQTQTSSAEQLGPTPAPDISAPGLSEQDNRNTVGFSVVPPDINGDIGLDASGNRIYIQYINSIWGVFDVNGSLINGPFAGNSFWVDFGGFCQSNNDGDPVVLYDDQAGRWFFSQFSINQGIQCVAVSTTSDPLGPYHRYAFTVTPGGANDYPKLGVWDDGTTGSSGQSAYTFTLRDFGGAGGSFSVSAGVMERDKMLLGMPAQFIKFSNPCSGADCIEGQLPPHLAGPTPPNGTCPTFWTAVDAAYDDSPFANDGYRNHRLCVDWSNLGNSTYTEGPLVVAGSNFDRFLGNGFSDCIGPIAGGEVLDCLAAFSMYRVQYRWFGSYGSVVFNTTVDAGSDRAGIRWSESRSADGDSGWTLQQDGTYAPTDDLERWMGSIAQDRDGNMALGYSTAGSNLFPAVRYTSRMAGDAAGTMSGGEISCVEGTGAQIASSNRWGDYSSMSVDPTDDCTFWYTQEYYETTGSFDFNTRICSFRLPSCVATGEAPVVAITAPANGLSFEQGDPVSFAGTANDNEDGVISANLAWTSSLDGSIGNGAGFNTTGLSDGNHTITAVVVDSDGRPGSDQITVTITPPPTSSMHVDNILTGTQNAPRGKKFGTATVTIRDNNGNSVGAGYTVTGDFSGSYNESGLTADTDSNGVAVFVSSGTAKKNIVVEFCVSDVSESLLTYNPDGNAANTTCAVTPPPPDPTSVHVGNVSTGSKGIGGGSKVGTATVSIVDNNGNPAAGYTVTGDFSGDITDSGRSGVTGADGTVKIETSGSKKGKVNVDFCISDVSGTEVYISGDNTGGTICP